MIPVNLTTFVHDFLSKLYETDGKQRVSDQTMTRGEKLEISQAQKRLLEQHASLFFSV